MIHSHSNRSFKAYASHFFDDDGSYVRYAKVSGRAHSENYVKKLRAITKNYLVPAFGEMTLEGITSNDIKAALSKFKENGLSNKSVNHIFSVLRIILNDSLNNGMMYLSPLRGVRPFAEERKPRKPFELDEAVRILHEDFKSEKIRIFILTAALIGMRAGEIMAIRRETLHPTYIEVKDQIQNRTLCQTKTRQTRIVPIIPELYELLNTLAERDFTFDGIRRGEPNDELRKILIQLMPEKRKSAGYCLHSFRHFCNTRMLSENISPVKVTAVLGHSTSTLSDIQKTYTNFTEADFKEVYEFQKKYFHLLND